MKKFFFRLEILLTVRQAREGTIKRELEGANSKWNQVKEKEKTLQTQISALIEEMQKKRLTGKWELQETYAQILDHLNTSQTQLQQTLQALAKQIEEQKERLKEAIQGRKVIEKIKEKHYAGWQVRESRSEGVILEEAALKKPVHIE